ncbi:MULTISPECIES: hypothetical protein [unclassified Janibacter]|uniref:hypothetical protein n=1 Tax=unclassified Janibacter TaxID=2649294 RepID=UPI003D0867DE
MAPVIIGLALCIVLSVAVLLMVAVPARREGRDLLTPRGEKVVVKVRQGTESAAARTGDLISSARSSARRESA